MIPGRRLPTSTAELYAIGLGSGPPLLFLHGVTANCFAWLPVMELLQDSYTVTAVDQRGHGRSGLPRDHRFDAAAYARDTAEAAAGLGHGPVVVVGHSLGARNAIAAAARRPDVIAAVVAIEFTPFIERRAFNTLDVLAAHGLRSFRDHADLSGYLSRHYRGLPGDAVARRAKHGYVARADGRLVPLADADAMRATCAGLREDLTPDLGRLGVPALLVRGSGSAFVSGRAFRAALGLRPRLRGAVVDGTDHYVPEERPSEVARLIREFMAELTAVTQAPVVSH